MFIFSQNLYLSKMATLKGYNFDQKDSCYKVHFLGKVVLKSFVHWFFQNVSSAYFMPDVIQGSLHISMKQNNIPIFKFFIMCLENK